MDLNQCCYFIDLSIRKTIILCYFNIRLQPEFRFAVSRNHMYVWALFFS